MRRKICIVLAILWMGVIFYLSNQPAAVSSAQSNNVTSTITTLPIIGNIMKYLSYINMDKFVVRKLAHMFLYFILVILLFMSVYKQDVKKSFIISFWGTFFYACSDEFHQLFVPGRSGEVRDIMIDLIGAIIGVFIINIIFKFKLYNKTKK